MTVIHLPDDADGLSLFPEEIAELGQADQQRLYELSAQGVIQISPAPSEDERAVCERIAAWLSRSHDERQVRFASRVRTMDPGWCEGSRQADMTYGLADDRMTPSDDAHLLAEEVRLVVEVVSDYSRFVDSVEKVIEYAVGGIPYYWLIFRDQDTDEWLVTEYHNRDGRYREVNPMRKTLDWFISTPVPPLSR